MAKVNYKQLLAQCVEELRLKTEAHDGVWHLSEADWELDQVAGTIVFTAPNGMIATCPAQIIGTYDSLAETWMWGWDHPSVAPALQLHAKKVRALGQKNNQQDLTTQKINITEDEAWELIALACKVNDALGAYRGPVGSTLVFVTFWKTDTEQLTRPTIYLRWRILARIRRFLRPTFRRPLPRRRAMPLSPCNFQPTSYGRTM